MKEVEYYIIKIIVVNRWIMPFLKKAYTWPFIHKLPLQHCFKVNLQAVKSSWERTKQAMTLHNQIKHSFCHFSLVPDENLTFFKVQMRNTQKVAFLDLFRHSHTVNTTDIHTKRSALSRTHQVQHSRPWNIWSITFNFKKRSRNTHRHKSCTLISAIPKV